MNSRVRIDKQAWLEWVGASDKDELSLIKKYLKTTDLAYLLDLYRPYMHLVYGLANNFTGNPKQSQEIVYCIFKKLIKEVQQQEIRAFSGWLYHLSRRFCQQWLQRGRSEDDQIVAMGGSIQTPVTFYYEDDQDLEQEISHMEDEVKNTREQQERCSELFFNKQKCFQEIAYLTGLEISQIKRHLRNSKRRANIYQE